MMRSTIPPSPQTIRTTLPSSAGASDVVAALRAHGAARPESTAVAALAADGAPVESMSYSQLDAATTALGRRIAEAAAPGEVVILVGPSSPAFVAWFCGAMAAGVRLFPVPMQTARAELAAFVQASRPVAMIAFDEAVARSHSLACIPWRSAVANGEAPARTLEARAPGSIVLHSSGTTGVSKLVVRESPALDAVAANVVHGTDLGPEDCVLAAVPLCHSYGVDLLLASLLSGASMQVPREFDPATLAASLATCATVFPGVPFMFEAIARLAPQLPSARLRLAFSAGAPLSEQVRDSFERGWGVRVGDLYGATELGSVTLNHPSSASYLPGCVGTPLPGVRLRILDANDPERELPRGKEGHVAIAAPSMLSGYLDNGLALVGGFLLTGDLGRMDQSGRLFITGRIKLLIDAGGFKVNPLEVEAALAAHPGVQECVVLPLRLSDTISRLRGVFVPRDRLRPPSSDELRDFLKQRLSLPKIPRQFEPVASLPKSASGKILRHLIPEPRP